VIDLHAHVLPGVDDGARDLAEAVEMLRAAALDGTRVVCCTPHAHGPDYDVPPASAQAAFAALSAAAAAAGVAIELRLAAENWYRPDLPTLAREGRIATYSSTGLRRALVEFPPTHVPPEAFEVCFQLRLEGVLPVIAHPERNPSFWARPELADRFKEQGALLQVTAGSLTGLFRKESLACARALVKRGVVDLLASDCHRKDRRPPGLSEAVAVATKWAGKAAATRWTETVPSALLAGTEVP
jgi:protein-tyrosine phosphatase